MSRIHFWLAWAQLIGALAAGALWYLWPDLAGWPLVLGLAPLLVRLPASRRVALGSLLDIPLLCFLITGLFGVWAAYDPAAAWGIMPSPSGMYKYWLILASLLLCYALMQLPTDVSVQAIGAGWAVFGAVVALYFLATNDFAAGQAKDRTLYQLGMAIQSIAPSLPGHRLSPNVAGGIVAMNVPYALGWLIDSRGESASEEASAARIGLVVRPLVIPALVLVVMLFGLLMTVSRGSWLGIGSALALWAVWWTGNRMFRQLHAPRAIRILVVVSLALLLVAILGVCGAVLMSRNAPLPQWFPSMEAMSNRLQLVRRSMSLVGDYPLTGSGLGGFTMVHASYDLLTNVGYIVNSHNLYLDIAIEQGLPGLASYGVILALTIIMMWRARRKPEEKAWRVAALFSLVTIMVHGLFDDVLYGSRGLLLLFVPSAMMTVATRRGVVARLPVAARPRRKLARLTPVLLVLVLLSGAMVWNRPLLSWVFSNLGSVRQTKAELSAYEWPKWPIQDAVRREVDLSPAVASFQHSIALMPGNGPANRRLGMIELSLGEYSDALEHLTKAYSVEPDNMATRQLLGEALIVNGQLESGRELWTKVDNSLGQLELRPWWYDYIGEETRAQWLRKAVDGL